MTPVQQALGGLIGIVLLAALGVFGFRVALGDLSETYEFDVVVGESGQGLVSGSDVKARGIIIGQVRRVRLDEQRRAVVTLDLDPKQRIPERATFAVTAKTLFGEKQVEIDFDGAISDGPFLAHGALIDDDARVVEVEDIIARLSPLLAAIDPDDLATISRDAFGALDGAGRDIARFVDEGARASDVLARSVDDQAAAIAALALIADELADEGPTFNRMARSLSIGLPTISDNQEGIRVLLDDVAATARTLDVTLTVIRPDLDRLIIDGANVTRLLGRYPQQVGEIASGLTVYASRFEEGFESPGVQGPASRFLIQIDDADWAALLCGYLPEEMSGELPTCLEQPEPQPAAQAAGTTIMAPVDPAGLATLAAPSPPAPREGLEALLRRATEGAR